MSKIGIFWVLDGKVIGKARDLGEGVDCDGRIDSPDQHVAVWEQLPEFSKLRKKGMGYESILRGRVIWSQQSNRAVIYLDRRSLENLKIRKKIATFFELNNCDIEWVADLHYTTDPEEIEKLFEE